MAKKKQPDFVVDEGVESIYAYHIRRPGTHPEGGYLALCGRRLLGKQLPMDAWGYRSHLHEKYCKECERLWKEQQ